MKKNQGFVAIASVLVVAAVVLVVGLTVALLSVNDIQSSQANKKSDDILDLVEGCVEDALLRLNETNTIPASLPIPQGTCSVTINSHVGTSWTFTVTASIDNYTKSIQVSATRSSTVDITSWIQQ